MKITEESMRQQELEKSGLLPEQPETPQVPEPRQTEREKLRSMSFRDRNWYIWTYYKFHIIGAVTAVLVLISMGRAFYQTTYDTVLHCFYLNSRSEMELDTTPLEQEFAEYMGLGKKEQIVAESGFVAFDENASEYSYAIMAKISALVMSGELDIMIGDTISTDHYASLDGFADLEATLSPEALSLVRDRLYYASGSDGTERAIAIDLGGTGFSDRSHLGQDVPLLAISAGSQHTDTVEQLIRYIFSPAPAASGSAASGSAA